MRCRGFFIPGEIAERIVEAGVNKCRLSKDRLFLLAIIAGAYIAFGAASSNMVVHSLPSNLAGLKRLLAGAIFPVGLMMIILGGGELFTGNNLLIFAVMQRKITWRAMLSNWALVYAGNFIGSVFLAWLLFRSGLFFANHGELGMYHVSTSLSKVNITFSQAFIRGICCNVLVVMAVWMSYGANTLGDKILAIWFPVMLFVAGGYEHCIANMYYIPAGIFALDIPAVSNQLNWQSFLIKNLIPVTLGNIVGGSLLVGITYWYVYCYKNSS